MDIFLILSPKYIMYVLQDICNKIEGENYMFIIIKFQMQKRRKEEEINQIG